MIFRKLDRYRNMGLLLLRIGMGIAYLYHGLPKLLAGPEKWEALGGAMGTLGIDFALTFWGFMAAFSESAGGLLLMLGLLFRPACGLLTSTMVVASLMHLQAGHGLLKASHAMENALLFAAWILIGPGRFSLDEMLSRRGSPGLES